MYTSGTHLLHVMPREMEYIALYCTVFQLSTFYSTHINIKMATYLITGSSRGLGLSLVSRLATLPTTDVGTIIATSRHDNSPRLRDLVHSSSGRVRFVPMDVTDSQSVREAVRSVEERLQGRGVDVLVNNAGVFPGGRGLEDMYVSTPYSCVIYAWIFVYV